MQRRLLVLDEPSLFYITSTLASSHYAPEVCIKVTIVNFTVTLGGLEDQVLVDACTHTLMHTRADTRAHADAHGRLLIACVCTCACCSKLLAVAVKLERPDLAKAKDDLVQQQNNFKIKILQMEDDILRRLAEAEERSGAVLAPEGYE